MGNSLRDQLLKAGMTSKKRAKAAEVEARKEARQKRQKDDAGAAAAAAGAAKAAAEKAARDREESRRQDAARREKELLAQACDLVRSHALKQWGGNVRHHFADGKHVKSLDVRDDVHLDLAAGRLAIARIDGEYFIIPEAAAEKVDERAPDLLVFWAEPDGEAPEDDPYAVPDDLMW